MEKQMNVTKKDFDVSKISYDEIFDELYDALIIALEKVNASTYWPHTLELKKDSCSIKNYTLKDGEKYPCVKLSMEWSQISRNQGNIVCVVVSPFGAKYYDVIQTVEFESEELNRAIKNLMIKKFPNSSYMVELKKYQNAQQMSV